jgi:hypothetical protein
MMSNYRQCLYLLGQAGRLAKSDPYRAGILLRLASELSSTKKSILDDQNFYASERENRLSRSINSWLGIPGQDQES